MDLQSLVSKLRGSPVTLFVSVSFTSLLLYLLTSYVRSPLRQYPGPALAKYTNLWRLYHTMQGSWHLVIDQAHKKYGPVVRIGPNVLDVDYPSMLKTIFNVKAEWRKTESVSSSSVLIGGKVVFNIFSELDPAVHAQTKKPIAKFYSAGAVPALEPHMDKTINLLCSELEKRFMGGGSSAGKAVDLGEWISYYTWDVIGAITFSQPYGYLSKGTDFDGTIAGAESMLAYFSLCFSIPALDYFLSKNPIYQLGPAPFESLTGTTVQRLVARLQGLDKDHHDASQPDYLDKFIEVKAEDPANVTDGHIIAWLMINTLAGADTTAVATRSALYYSLKNPSIWSRLQNELSSAGLTSSHCPVAYKAVRGLPYLDGIVREALRILPGVSLGLERYVPPGGHNLPDGFVPENAILSFNPYVICRNKGSFGDDADEFKPERWLKRKDETEEGYAARLLVMNNADLSFGGGSRSCVGKHLGLTQVYKVVATLALMYDIELTNPEREWVVKDYWFPVQKGLVVDIKKRV
ncbi:cytochrome P450 [Podospora didyma]|uniref:Cytochrome P450 n=1 Tax=Podospora didyma TaxID=330526 RepID=A0AAE0N2U4_9PEZI|nr:cytochrome P450 [Podospora didyma]